MHTETNSAERTVKRELNGGRFWLKLKGLNAYSDTNRHRWGLTGTMRH